MMFDNSKYSFACIFLCLTVACSSSGGRTQQDADSSTDDLAEDPVDASVDSPHELPPEECSFSASGFSMELEDYGCEHIGDLEVGDFLLVTVEDGLVVGLEEGLLEIEDYDFTVYRLHFSGMEVESIPKYLSLGNRIYLSWIVANLNKCVTGLSLGYKCPLTTVPILLYRAGDTNNTLFPSEENDPWRSFHYPFDIDSLDDECVLTDNPVSECPDIDVQKLSLTEEVGSSHYIHQGESMELLDSRRVFYASNIVSYYSDICGGLEVKYVLDLIGPDIICDF